MHCYVCIKEIWVAQVLRFVEYVWKVKGSFIELRRQRCVDLKESFVKYYWFVHDYLFYGNLAKR